MRGENRHGPRDGDLLNYGRVLIQATKLGFKQNHQGRKFETVPTYRAMTFKIKITIKRKHIEYFKTNWGAPFVIAFQVLLIAAAGYLAAGAEAVANELAVYAYYSLVAGVILQLASLLGERRENEKGKRSE